MKTLLVRVHNKIPIAILFFIVFFLCGLKSVITPLFVVNRYVCTAQGLSSTYRHCIQEKLEELAQHNYNTHFLIAQLKELFPVIKHLSFSYKPHMVHVAITSHRLRCIINDKTVLTDVGIVCEKAIFSTNNSASLPSLFVTPKNWDAMIGYVPQFLSSLSPDFNNFFDVRFVDQHCVYMIDKREPLFVIMCSADQSILSTLLQHCDLIKQKLSSQGAFNKKVTWIADTRFVNHVIVYRDRL